MKTANLKGKENEKEEQEAMKKGNQAMMDSTATLKAKADDKEEEEKAMLSMWDCGSPLYDSYELVSLNHLIDRHLMAFPSSLHNGSNPIINRFTNNSHDIMVPEVAQEVGSPVKFKGSFMVKSLGKFLMKMKKRKDNGERRKKNKGMRRGLAGFVVDCLCGGSRKHT